MARSGRPVRVEQEWGGGSTDERDGELWRLSPGVVSGPDAWARLWAAWRLGEPPAVDFGRDLVLVAAGQGFGNRIVAPAPSLDAAGNLRFDYGVTEMAFPGFVYRALRVRRAGIKAVNGEPIGTGD
jgi:hypothetical protein